MSKGRKVIPLVEDVTIESAAAEGVAIAHVDGMVVFVPKVVPGDVVDLQIVKKRRSHAEGRAVKIKSLSSLRVEAQCPHFAICGGCKWQTMRYDAQLKAKQQQVADNLSRLGGVDCSGMRPICGADNIFYYRNKLEYTFSTRTYRTAEELAVESVYIDKGALGFHAPSLFDKVINIEHCALQTEPSNAIRLAIRDYATAHNLSYYDIRNHVGLLRNVVIRNTTQGDWMVILIVAEDKPEEYMPLLEMLHNRFPEITSLQYIINSKFNDSYSDLDVRLYYGKDHIDEVMKGYNGGKDLHYIINAKSFYQTNSVQAQRLYSFVAEFAELQATDVVYDLYTGAGTIALFLAAMCKHVVGIEYVEEAIVDARRNAQNNGFDNTTFVAGDMAEVLTADFISQHGRPDVIITDPPRAGMHAKVVEQILATEPRKIVYVSCNPATQARDLQLLAEKYKVLRIQPVDMFPHTHHVENVVELVLK